MFARNIHQFNGFDTGDAGRWSNHKPGFQVRERSAGFPDEMLGFRGRRKDSALPAEKICETLSTETKDPATKSMRVYVGNLCKARLSRADVYRIFSRFGPITALSNLNSKHPDDVCSYAFIQFTSKADALNAVSAENGKEYAEHKLDVRLASAGSSASRSVGSLPTAAAPLVSIKSEPKPPVTQISRAEKRPLKTLPASDSSHPKRSRFEQSLGAESHSVQHKTNKASLSVVAESVVVETTKPPASDILVCGGCRMSFSSVDQIVLHKQRPCQPQMPCGCADAGIPKVVGCAVCLKEFSSPWQLIVHIHQIHNIMVCVQADGRPVALQPPALTTSPTTDKQMESLPVTSSRSSQKQIAASKGKDLDTVDLEEDLLNEDEA